MLSFNPQYDSTAEDAFIFGNATQRAARRKRRKERRAQRKARREARKNDPKRIARKVKRKDFWKRMGNAYEDIGGGAAVGSAIDTLLKKSERQEASHTINTQNGNTTTDGRAEKARENTGAGTATDTKALKKDPTLWYIAGGIVGLSILSYVVIRSNKHTNL